MASVQRQESVACYIPSVRSASPGTAIQRRMSSRLKFDTQRIQTYLENSQDQTALSSVLQAAWAFILHYYTGLDQICFAYDELDLAGSPSKTGPSVAKAQFHDGTSLQDVLEQFKGMEGKPRLPSETHSENRSTHFHYNTTVMLHLRSSASNFSRPSVSATSQAAMALPEGVSFDLCIDIS
jgi:hypothetical protein